MIQPLLFPGNICIIIRKLLKQQSAWLCLPRWGFGKAWREGVCYPGFWRQREGWERSAASWSVDLPSPSERMERQTGRRKGGGHTTSGTHQLTTWLPQHRGHTVGSCGTHMTSISTYSNSREFVHHSVWLCISQSTTEGQGRAGRKESQEPWIILIPSILVQPQVSFSRLM